MKAKTKTYMKNPMSRFEPLHVATMLLCVAPFSRAFATERQVPAHYPTIQAAVNAAVPGDTVRIAAGNYSEQVVVAFKTGLTLAGEPGTVLHAFPGMVPTLQQYGSWLALPICAVYRSDVVVSGLHFEGESLGSSTVLEGVSFHAASGTVTNCTFSGFRAQGTPNSNAGWGLFCANLVATGAGPMSITVADNTFTNNQTAIRMGGDPLFNPELLRLTANVHGNTIKGFGPSPGQNRGIVLYCGVSGDIAKNLFADFAATGSGSALSAFDGDAQSHSRFVSMQPLNFEKNIFTNNGVHLFLMGNDSRVVNNIFSGTDPGVFSTGGFRVGGLQVGGTNVLVANNNFLDMPTGALLIGTESFPPPWPAFPPAANPSLVGNWFCNVPEPIRFNALITVLQEQGTETNCPFAPRFQPLTRSSNGESLVLLRGWHGDSYVVESSTDLQNWAPAHTNSMTLPLLEFRDANASATPHRFYRAFKQ